MLPSLKSGYHFIWIFKVIACMFILLCFFILFREGALRLHLQVMIAVSSGCLSCKALSHKSWKPKTQILDLILQKFTVMVFVLWDSYGTAEQRQLLLPELTSMVFSSPLTFSCSDCMRHNLVVKIYRQLTFQWLIPHMYFGCRSF